MIFKNLKKRTFTALFLILLFLLIFKSQYFMGWSLLVLGIYCFIEFSKLMNKIFKSNLFRFFSNIFFLIYIFLFCFMFFFFSNILALKIILFSLLLGCISSDIGGYIFGSIFKGQKLSKISPNKTISGAIGSLLLTCITLSGAIYYFTNNISLKIIIISLFTSLFCQTGDLLFSYLKRKAKIKDTGNFFPGHGGVLDRFDGILLGLPLGFFILILIY